MRITERWHTALLALAALSAAVDIAATLGALAGWLPFVFKPLTTLLIIAWAWPRGADSPLQQQWVRIGLALSLAGDIALLWPKQGFLPGLIAFLLAHLAYIRAFCVPLRLAAKPAPFALYAVVAALILSQLWHGVPNALRVPVLAYVVCLAGMAAQARSRHGAGHAEPLHRRNEIARGERERGSAREAQGPARRGGTARGGGVALTLGSVHTKCVPT